METDRRGDQGQHDEPEARPAWVQALIDVPDNPILEGAAEPFDVTRFCDEAIVTTGLDDFGGSEFVEPLERLLRSADTDGDLHVVGRWRLRQMVLRLLANRLKIVECLRQRPLILDERVHAPIVVSGAPRSGTSILHQLLGSDPANRAPLSWEVWCPVPPPSTVTDHPDVRIALADRELRLSARLAPAFDGMHEMSSTMPRECIGATAHAFLSDDFDGNFGLPSYDDWLITADLGPAYRWHRLVLQILQYGAPRRQWVLKAPSHLAALDDLFREYPDAELVITHRDPLTSLSSVSSMTATLHEAHSTRADHDAILTQQLTRNDRLLNGLVGWCDRNPDRHVHHVSYDELTDDPVATMARLYRDLGRPLSDEARLAMASHVTEKPQGRHGGHHHAFAALGLDVDTERARFRPYQERFDVASDF